jgi:hypothetical protein
VSGPGSACDLAGYTGTRFFIIMPGRLLERVFM